jgi:Tfp pilus assembly protein PilE
MFRYIRSPCGYILTELVAVLAIIVVLGCTGAASYVRYVDYAKLLRAKYELNLMAPVLDIYYVENGEYPINPSQANIIWPCIDPWGEPYQYRNEGTKYIMTVRDREGRNRLEAWGEAETSKVVETGKTDDIHIAECAF